MTKRNVLYVGNPSLPLGPTVAESAFSQFVLASCHVEQNPIMQRFRILDGPMSIETVFGSDDFSQWLAPLNEGVFPPSLRTASATAFQKLGEPLSDNVTVAVGASGSSWTLTDDANDAVFPMQVDLDGTFVSFSGQPLATVTGPSSGVYVADLDAGVVPSDMLATAGLTGPTSNYSVTPEQPQKIGPGRQQWLLTNLTNGFVYVLAVGTQADANAFVVRGVNAFFTQNMAEFTSSLQTVTGAGKPIYLSLGGWSDAITWQIMGESTLQTLIVVAEILGAFGLSGVDYDWETPSGGNDIEAMTRFAQQLQHDLPGVTVTICPYSGTIGTLQSVWSNVGRGPTGIAWANCQNYNPSNNSPSLFKPTFVDPIAQQFGLSTNEAASYVNVGFGANGLTAGAFADLVRQVVQGVTGPTGFPGLPTIGGAFTFDYNSMTGPVQVWAEDVAEALGATGS
jgi:hypothetical protein